MLYHLVGASATKSKGGRGGTEDEELAKPGESVRLSSWVEIRRRANIEAVPVSSCNC